MITLTLGSLRTDFWVYSGTLTIFSRDPGDLPFSVPTLSIDSWSVVIHYLRYNGCPLTSRLLIPISI